MHITLIVDKDIICKKHSYIVFLKPITLHEKLYFIICEIGYLRRILWFDNLKLFWTLFKFNMNDILQVITIH